MFSSLSRTKEVYFDWLLSEFDLVVWTLFLDRRLSVIFIVRPSTCDLNATVQLAVVFTNSLHTWEVSHEIFAVCTTVFLWQDFEDGLTLEEERFIRLKNKLEESQTGGLVREADGRKLSQRVKELDSKLDEDWKQHEINKNRWVLRSAHPRCSTKYVFRTTSCAGWQIILC